MSKSECRHVRFARERSLFRRIAPGCLLAALRELRREEASTTLGRQPAQSPSAVRQTQAPAALAPQAETWRDRTRSTLANKLAHCKADLEQVPVCLAFAVRCQREYLLFRYAAYLATEYIPFVAHLDDRIQAVNEVCESLRFFAANGSRQENRHVRYSRLLLAPVLWSLVFAYAGSRPGTARRSEEATQVFARLERVPLLPASVQVALGALAIVTSVPQALLWVEVARRASAAAGMPAFARLFAQAVTNAHCPNSR